MALHLIESRQVSAAARMRNPGGIFTSLVLHAGLVTAGLLLATGHALPKLAAPVVSKITFVEPPPPVQRVFAAGGPVQGHPGVDMQTYSIPEISIPDLNAAVVSLPSPSAITEIHFRMRGTPDGDRLATRGTPGGDGNGIHETSDVDKPVMLLPGMPVPRYPESMRSAAIQDTVVVMFVVDTLGKVELSSLTVERSPHPDFVQAVRASLGQARFKPAEASGALVRQRAIQAFVFTLSR